MLDALRGGILGRDMSKFMASTSKSGSGPKEGKIGRAPRNYLGESKGNMMRL